MAVDPPAFGRIRVMLASLLTLGLAGTVIELVLLDHVEEWRQLLPFAAIGGATVMLAWVVLRPSRTSVRVFQAVMAALIAAGVAGVWFHYRGNLEFQMEMDATQRGLSLLLKVLGAKTPPALAPGVMVQLGLLGLVYTYRHPFLTKESR